MVNVSIHYKSFEVVQIKKTLPGVCRTFHIKGLQVLLPEVRVPSLSLFNELITWCRSSGRVYAEDEKEWEEDRKRDKRLRDGRTRGGQRMCWEGESERAAHCVTRGQMVATLHSRRGTCDSREPWWSLPHPRLYCWHLSTYSGRERRGEGGGGRGRTHRQDAGSTLCTGGLRYWTNWASCLWNWTFRVLFQM